MALKKPHIDGFGVKADRHLDSPSAHQRPHDRSDDSRTPGSSSQQERSSRRDGSDGIGDVANSLLKRAERNDKLSGLAEGAARFGAYAGLAYGTMELVILARRAMVKYLTGVDPDAPQAAEQAKALGVDPQKGEWAEKAVRLDQAGMQQANGKLAEVAGAVGINLPGQTQTEGGRAVAEGKLSSLEPSDTKIFTVGRKEPGSKEDQSVIALSTGAGRETLSAYSQKTEDGLVRKRNFVSELPEGSLKLGENGVDLSSQADKALQIGSKSLGESSLEQIVGVGNRETDVMTMLNKEGRVSKEARFYGRNGQGAVEISEGRAVFSQLDERGKPISSRELKDPGISVSPETGAETLPRGVVHQIGAFAADPSKFPAELEPTAVDKVLGQAKAMTSSPLDLNLDVGRTAPMRDMGMSR
ncbi:hypothetical protein [Microvirga sp. VF16]|uniref:hypothetical protein n=1 Tax=Microvirga sp. VF16 TaxID=2807101 RepID=UPI00193CAD3B|nr:hypothetical protein [Microvirga sp. VF16]QRM35012.1 hypothetical protein JO965_39110 [Microvirga sp. VF16]